MPRLFVFALYSLNDMNTWAFIDMNNKMFIATYIVTFIFIYCYLT